MSIAETNRVEQLEARLIALQERVEQLEAVMREQLKRQRPETHNTMHLKGRKRG